MDSKKLRTGDLTETDWSKIGRAIGRLDAPLYLDDNPNVTVMEIRAKARRMKARHGGLGLDRRRLPAADVRPAGGREPPGRGERAQPGPQDPGPRAAGADHGAVAAVPEPGEQSRQAADALGPPRVGLHRAGRGRGDVHLPRRGVQPGLARIGARPRSSWPSTATGRSARGGWSSSAPTPASTTPLAASERTRQDGIRAGGRGRRPAGERVRRRRRSGAGRADGRLHAQPVPVLRPRHRASPGVGRRRARWTAPAERGRGRRRGSWLLAARRARAPVRRSRVPLRAHHGVRTGGARTDRGAHHHEELVGHRGRAVPPCGRRAGASLPRPAVRHGPLDRQP